MGGAMTLTCEDVLVLASQHVERDEHDIAINLLASALKAVPDHPQLLFGLGIILDKRVDRGFGMAHILRAVQICRDPEMLRLLLTRLHSGNQFREVILVGSGFTDLVEKDPFLLLLLGDAHYKIGDNNQALPLLEKALGLAPTNTDIAHNLSIVQCLLERYEDSVRTFSLKTKPYDTAGSIGASSAGAYSHLAENYDQKALHHKFSRSLIDLVEQICPGRHARRVLDLGCGTGNLSECFIAAPDLLVGIDLSSGMLEKAKAKCKYDRLVEGDLVASLSEMEQTFDTILSACVLYHLSDLRPLFEQVARHLESGGLFAFSVDPIPDGQDIAVSNPGEYCHSRRYLRRVAADAGLTELEIKIAPHRATPGFWCVFRK
jgi:predicted TPR repeat methyltransferase